LARYRWTRPLLAAALLGAALLLAVFLDVPDRLSRLWRPSAHERYADGLRRAKVCVRFRPDPLRSA
jgi:hypothetical protein